MRDSGQNLQCQVPTGSGQNEEINIGHNETEPTEGKG